MLRPHPTRPWLPLLVLIGCGVPRARHQEVVVELALTRARCAVERRCQTHLAATTKEIAQLDAANRGAEARLAALERRIGQVGLDLGSDLDSARRQLDEVRRARGAAEARAEEYRRLGEALRRQVERGDLQLEELGGHLQLKLPDRVLFSPGKATLSPQGQRALMELGPVLQRLSRRELQVAGHTDATPARGRRRPGPLGNWALSTERALNVVGYLIQAGVDPRRLSAAGYGAERPIAPNKSASGRALNRRIEIVLLPLGDELPAGVAPAAGGQGGG